MRAGRAEHERNSNFFFFLLSLSVTPTVFFAGARAFTPILSHRGRACPISSRCRVVSCIVASANGHGIRADRECPASLVQNPFSRAHLGASRPLMRPSFHSTDIIVGFLRVTLFVVLFIRDGWSGRENRHPPICRYFPCARGVVRPCLGIVGAGRQANEPTDTLRVGVIRSSIDSYAHSSGPPANDRGEFLLHRIACEKGAAWSGNCTDRQGWPWSVR